MELTFHVNMIIVVNLVWYYTDGVLWIESLNVITLASCFSYAYLDITYSFILPRFDISDPFWCVLFGMDVRTR
jgi:hypothetical protein